MAPPKLTCFVFAWNELQSLRPVVSGLLEALQKLGVSHELVIIDDGSTDGTSDEADRLATEHPSVRVIHHGDNRGLGGTYRTGFEQARGEFFTFFPGDGQFPPENLALLYPLAEQWDVVLGNLPGRKDSFVGAILGRVERLLYRAAVGFLPRLEGVFMMRRIELERIQLRSQGRGWAIVWELLVRAHRNGCRMVGQPVILVPRQHGVSKVNNLRNVLANVTQILRLRGLLRD